MSRDPRAIEAEFDAIVKEVSTLQAIYDEHECEGDGCTNLSHRGVDVSANTLRFLLLNGAPSSSPLASSLRFSGNAEMALNELVSKLHEGLTFWQDHKRVEELAERVRVELRKAS